MTRPLWRVAPEATARRRAGPIPAGSVGPSLAGRLPDPAAVAATLWSSVEGGSAWTGSNPHSGGPQRPVVACNSSARFALARLRSGRWRAGVAPPGPLVIGRLAVGRAVVRRLRIEEFEVQRLRVHELQVDREQRPAVQA